MNPEQPPKKALLPSALQAVSVPYEYIRTGALERALSTDVRLGSACAKPALPNAATAAAPIKSVVRGLSMGLSFTKKGSMKIHKGSMRMRAAMIS